MPHYEADELTGLEEHERDEYHPGSDYEYCRFHPTEVISNGMFDAPCGGCESEDDREPETLTPKELEAMAEKELHQLRWDEGFWRSEQGDIPF
jgi:hypothetical protein